MSFLFLNKRASLLVNAAIWIVCGVMVVLDKKSFWLSKDFEGMTQHFVGSSMILIGALLYQIAEHALDTMGENAIYCCFILMGQYLGVMYATLKWEGMWNQTGVLILMLFLLNFKF